MRSTPNEQQLDEIDRQLLTELQLNADRALHALGDIVGLSASAASRRINSYKTSGVIERVVAIVAPHASRVTFHTLCHITCTRDSHEELSALKDQLCALTEVTHCYEVAGAVDLIAVFAAPDIARYTELTDEHLSNNPTIERFETHVVLDVVKSTTQLSM
ncbi:Lrp/AsnC family transcriptional regulator [Acidimicrobiaceae bacterium AH-315-P05]|nr:Lrp/AsnC family transcriptional regulator [Acidimicrobiaceae bacterium AH-315-P05]